jgi:hypothetical protein
MESPSSVYRRFLDYYLRKLRQVEAILRRGQSDMIDAPSLVDEDLTHIKHAHEWIIRYGSEYPEIAQFSLAYAGVDGRILRLGMVCVHGGRKG